MLRIQRPKIIGRCHLKRCSKNSIAIESCVQGEKEVDRHSNDSVHRQRTFVLHFLLQFGRFGLLLVAYESKFLLLSLHLVFLHVNLIQDHVLLLIEVTQCVLDETDHRRSRENGVSFYLSHLSVSTHDLLLVLKMILGLLQFHLTTRF